MDTINEISKELAKRYATASHKDHWKRRYGAPDGRGGAVPFSSEVTKADGKEAKDAQKRKIKNRSDGLERAFNRMSEEEELDELSANGEYGGILTRYANKAKAGTKDRSKGIALAQKKKWGDAKFGLPEPKVKGRWHEEIEELDELSKETMQRYVKKGDRSYDHLVDRSYQDTKHAGTMNNHFKDRYHPAVKRAWATAVKSTTKANNRAKWLNHADKKIAEETALQELSSRSTLSYLNAACKDRAKAEKCGDKKRILKRERGAFRAIDAYNRKEGLPDKKSK